MDRTHDCLGSKGRFRPSGISVSAMWSLLRAAVGLLRDEPVSVVVCGLFAVANWLLDALSLWLLAVAFGSTLAPGPLLVAHGVGTILGQLPVTPGGIGLVEGVLVPALVAFGVSPGNALFAVLGWRALEYWLPIPLGALCGISLRASERRARATRPHGGAAGGLG